MMVIKQHTNSWNCLSLLLYSYSRVLMSKQNGVIVARRSVNVQCILQSICCRIKHFVKFLIWKIQYTSSRCDKISHTSYIPQHTKLTQMLSSISIYERKLMTQMLSSISIYEGKLKVLFDNSWYTDLMLLCIHKLQV